MATIMKLHRYIDHDSQMSPIDFQVTSETARRSGLACSVARLGRETTLSESRILQPFTRAPRESAQR
ncbi:hypothetical protein DPMN_136604 [Dreissena polymorpha]|uniref:Uncharacterized protein n=1 Tax=Dreissena polymorpha TaxID=45954 RepID=A0A9D4JCT5_DREPO|nr:hypothetical protein DPMN_136604 [Dreissena polymorpha]